MTDLSRSTFAMRQTWKQWWRQQTFTLGSPDEHERVRRMSIRSWVGYWLATNTATGGAV